MQDSSPSKVTISGLGSTTDYNGIQGSVINGTHDIGNVTEDSYTITLSGILLHQLVVWVVQM